MATAEADTGGSEGDLPPLQDASEAGSQVDELVFKDATNVDDEDAIADAIAPRPPDLPPPEVIQQLLDMAELLDNNPELKARFEAAQANMGLGSDEDAQMTADAEAKLAEAKKSWRKWNSKKRRERKDWKKRVGISKRVEAERTN